jgi:hypothetical protein
MFRATGLTGWQRAAIDEIDTAAAQPRQEPSVSDELQRLRAEADAAAATLQRVRRQIDAMAAKTQATASPQ